MAITIHIYYSGKGGSARAIAQEMCEKGIVDAILASVPNGVGHHALAAIPVVGGADQVDIAQGLQCHAPHLIAVPGGNDIPKTTLRVQVSDST